MFFFYSFSIPRWTLLKIRENLPAANVRDVLFFLWNEKKWLNTWGRINLPSGDKRKRVIFKQLLRDFSTAWVVGPLRPVRKWSRMTFDSQTGRNNVFPFSYCACHQNNYRSHRSIMPVRLCDDGVFKCFFLLFFLLSFFCSFYLHFFFEADTWEI